MMRSEVRVFLRSLPLWLRCFAVAWLALAVYWQWLAHSDGIFGEMWDTLPAFRQISELGVLGIAQELLRKYAQVHILAVPKLFFWIDFAWFGASGRFIRTASFLVSFACAGCLLRIALRDFQRPIACTIFALLLFFNPLQAYVINWESLLQYYLSVLFAVLALMTGWYWQRRLWLSCCFLVLSAFSCGSGIAAIAAFSFLLLVQWLRGRKYSSTVCFCYVVFLWVMGYILLPDATPNTVIQNEFSFFWTAPNLLLQYLAFPFSAWGDFRWLGAWICLSVLHSVWRCLIQRPGTLSDHVLILFFIIACTIVWGRYKTMGGDGDVSRYYVYMAPLWYFSLLKCWNTKNRLIGVLAGIAVLGMLLASIASSVVLGNYANKMEMAKVVALNGNMQHLARVREDVLRSLPATLENSRDYLRAQQMDIYYQLRTSVEPTDAICRASVVRKTPTTRNKFVDYILQEDSKNAEKIRKIYLADKQGAVLYYGTAFAAQTHIAGWNIALRDVRLRDWPLLLPVQWLPLAERQLFVHLPRAVDLSGLQWLGEDRHSNLCRLIIEKPLSAAQE